MDWKEYQRNWYLTHKEQLKQWRDENRDYINENARNYYKRNRDKLIEYNKQRYRDKMRTLKENPELHEQQKAKRRAYYAANKDRFHQYYEKQKLNSIKRGEI